MSHATKRDPAPPPELSHGTLEGLLGYQLRLAQVRVFDDFLKSLAPYELTPGLLGVLYLVQANPGINQTDLARAVQLDRSTMVGILDKLTTRTWVERRASADDRRVNGVWLTRAGSGALKKMQALVQEHEERIAANLSATERATLAALLQKVAG